MTGKIFRSTLLVAVAVLLCSFTVISGIAYNYFDSVHVSQLRDELSLAATGTEQQGLGYLQHVEAGRFRLTWIAPDGTVLYDTQADETAMENHGAREEILEALDAGSGSSVRYSNTLTEKTVYEALRLSDGSILRISAASATTATLILGMLQSVCVILFLAIVLSAVLSHRMARKIVEPLNKLDLEHPLQNDAYPELEPLLQQLGRQHLQISSQLKKLRWKTEEFQHITENMGEGLVLLEGKGLILSINPAAKRLFGAGDFVIGKDFLTLDPSPEMRNAVNAAFLEGSSGFLSHREGRSYRFSLNRIVSEGSVIGAVVLAYDVTEQFLAQQRRREFSANVSHELKTPLHSIMGSAELLEQGLVKDGDTPRFAGLIRKEAGRLLSLVEDIIRLSQLDEGVPMPREETELLSLARETAGALEAAAAEKQVTLHITGVECTVNGIPRLLGEILYNLCDNAIKYNVPGGSVTVDCRSEGGKTVLTVSDTGIGIPPEHQDRIFERFYRVDKSHSRHSGGTGLGLSIVKHAALIHNADLKLESTPDEGTTIKLFFPE